MTGNGANEPIRKWILTGGAGFLGTNFLQSSKPEDGEIVVLDRRISRWQVKKPWIRYIDQDVREVEAFRSELEPDSVVVHMASVSYPGKAEHMIESDIQDNVLGTFRFANACADQGVRAFLFLSSGGAIYGDQPMSPIPEEANPKPKSAYGAMKLATEHYLRIVNQLRGLPIASLRAANPFGPWHPGVGQGAINVFLHKMVHDEEIQIWGDGEQVRDYIPVADVCSAIRTIGKGFKEGCEAYNIGSGEGRTLKDTLRVAGVVTGKTPKVKYFPGRVVDVDSNILDTTKIKNKFGWRSEISFHDALEEAYNWMMLQAM